MTAQPSEASSPKKKAKAKAPRPDEMNLDVLEFITAIDEYKRVNSRPFPSWSEILEVFKELGYERNPDD